MSIREEIMRLIYGLSFIIFGITSLTHANADAVSGSWGLVDFPVCNYALQNGGEIIGSNVRQDFTFSIIYYPKSNDFLRIGISDYAKICEKFFPDN